jgi:ribonuclease J
LYSQALNDTSSSGFSDITDLSVCFETHGKDGKTIRTKGNKLDRKYQPFKFNEKFHIDGIEVEPYRVDHSLSGATGYIIHTSSGTIVYTGDFRFHGRREKESAAFMEACKEAKPDVLIIEGTRVDSSSSKKEFEVEDEICGISLKAKGLLVCNWSVRDTDRMLSFLNAAKKLGKKLAISLKQAYLLDELAKCGDSIAPKTDDEDLAIYANRKSWGVIGDSKWCDKIRDEDYDSWERPYLDRAVCYKDNKKCKRKQLARAKWTIINVITI